MKDRSKSGRWFTASLMFVGFLLTFFLDLTGLNLHQWIGILVGLLAAGHLWVHRGWVASVTRRLSSPRAGRARLFYLVDAGLLLGLGAIIFSGLIMSTWLDLWLAARDVWVYLHIVCSVLTLTLVVVKMGLHWRWIMCTSRQIVCRGGPTASREVLPKLAPAPAVRAARREMLGVMGVVCAAAAMGGASALSGLLRRVGTSEASQVASGTGSSAPSAQSASSAGASSSANASPSATASTSAGASSPVAVSPTATASASQSSASSSSSCVVRCSRGCSYPGRCSKYTDSNHNNRCDLGECM